MEPIYVKGVRVLDPSDREAIYNAIPKQHHKTIFDMLFWSGMRYVEVQRFHDHPEWYMKERRAIHLPEEAQLKVKRIAPERYIHPLPPQLDGLLPYFFSNKRPPVQAAWNRNMNRWVFAAGLGEKGMSSKVTRKTIESWMITAEIPLNVVCLRQGHDSLTSMRHYQGLPFTDGDRVRIKNVLRSWI